MRPRGRPRKNPSTKNSKLTEALTHTPYRDALSNITSNKCTLSVTNQSHNHSEQLNVTLAPEVSNPLLIKRPRGRPRKNPATINLLQPTSQNNDISFPTTNTITLSQASTQIPQKGVLSNITSSPFSIRSQSLFNSNQTKATVTPEVSTPLGPKRSRGRPVKTPTISKIASPNDVVPSSEPTVQKPVNKGGRPRKIVKEQSNRSSLNNYSSKSIQPLDPMALSSMSQLPHSNVTNVHQVMQTPSVNVCVGSSTPNLFTPESTHVMETNENTFT
ncbi:ATP-dependent DNA helicase PIF1-like protein, partial [Tanacetum coccineum]